MHRKRTLQPGDLLVRRAHGVMGAAGSPIASEDARVRSGQHALLVSVETTAGGGEGTMTVLFRGGLYRTNGDHWEAP